MEARSTTSALSMAAGMPCAKETPESMNDLSTARRRYAEELREKSRVRSPGLIRAFATVERECYLGPGPWQILDPASVTAMPLVYQRTPDADPIQLYRDVLVGIDAARGLNNGQPSAHALWMDALDPRPGDFVVHVGCGTGYYSAILAEAVEPRGRVTAIEIDPELATAAARNLAHRTNVQVVRGDGCTYDPGAVDAIYVNAGATHILPLWCDRLRPGGRLVVPLVRWPESPEEASASGMGVVVAITHREDGDTAAIISPVGIFPCLGAIDVNADRRLAEALARGATGDAVRSFRRGAHDQEPECWLHGDGFCLSGRAVPR